MSRSLARYREMRDFGATPEPSGGTSSRPTRASAREGIGGIYVVQKHDATRLHYDFRLELDGVLLSWAVPKEPSMSVGVRRLAVRTEDHPVEYAEFRGDIPEGHYGAGHVEIWDRGTWTPVGDADEALRSGHLKFDLDGGRLRGRFVLVRMKSRDGERHENWLLIREREAPAASHALPRKRPSRAVPRATATAATRATSATEESGKTGSASSRSVRRRRNGGDHGTER